ncbi:MAG: hypothetical protein EZS28_048995 [Streblomastix strix]|uniref:Uncharacterized protein n=1 Tax=Streblomastix strix TaxID=222440 RepID=A0A5J4TB42_9EUKA|nr:MAG: hypothetical protein EZS28_048995 [Streblomastix strix]
MTEIQHTDSQARQLLTRDVSGAGKEFWQKVLNELEVASEGSQLSPGMLRIMISSHPNNAQVLLGLIFERLGKGII